LCWPTSIVMTALLETICFVSRWARCQKIKAAWTIGTIVEFVLAHQHETSFDLEAKTKEDFDHLRLRVIN